tara:strand:+ start:24883 stop:25473 length:591 start_codon:yes stop_codon:yes gene_type:complete
VIQNILNYFNFISDCFYWYYQLILESVGESLYKESMRETKYQYRETEISVMKVQNIVDHVNAGQLDELPTWILTGLRRSYIIVTRWALQLHDVTIELSGFLVYSVGPSCVRAYSVEQFLKVFEMVPGIAVDVDSELIDEPCKSQLRSVPRVPRVPRVSPTIHVDRVEVEPRESCPGVCPTCENLSAVLRGMDIFPT